jgi:uncharacterized damage-inducible protein DinB
MDRGLVIATEKENLVFTLDGVRKLHGWTHSSLGLLLDHLFVISPEDYAKVLPAFGFPSVREQVIHIFNCESFWVRTLLGLRHVDRNTAECPGVADARRFQQEISQQTHMYLLGLTEMKLNSAQELHFSDGDVAVRTPAHILHHVLTHAFHHKGQIVAMCRALGHPAPDTDLNQFE